MADVAAHYSKVSELTLFVVSGTVWAEDLVQAIETHYRAHPTSVAIWDLSLSDLSNLDMQALVRVSDAANRHSEHRKNPRTIIVVRLEQESYLIRLYKEISEVRGSPVSYELYYTLDEAYRALGVADPFAEQRDSA